LSVDRQQAREPVRQHAEEEHVGVRPEQLVLEAHDEAHHLGREP
jgi:hypothetical protein